MSSPWSSSSLSPSYHCHLIVILVEIKGHCHCRSGSLPKPPTLGFIVHHAVVVRPSQTRNFRKFEDVSFYIFLFLLFAFSRHLNFFCNAGIELLVLRDVANIINNYTKLHKSNWNEILLNYREPEPLAPPLSPKR
jgi:hypothetical protein